MEINKLTVNHNLFEFDCGDDDLNDFLRNDSMNFMHQRIGNTWILEEHGRVMAYFTLLNDKISKTEYSNKAWRSVRYPFQRLGDKLFSSYPEVKIGRLAVDKTYHNKGLGRYLLSFIKMRLLEKPTDSAFRFITVDALISAIPFYEKNDFVMLSAKEERENTRNMYFDMMTLNDL